MSLPGHVFRGHVASLAPATGAIFSVIPPENATGNFTKIVQRVPVRIVLDGDADAAAPCGRACPPPSASTRGARDRMTAAAIRPTPAPAKRAGCWSLLPFVVMCVGMFIALLDIQIVASSLQDIGGGLSAAQDQISWVQTAYLIAEIIMIPLSGWLTRVFSTRWLFTASAAGFTSPACCAALAWNIESMIVFRALQGLLGASMIPTVFTSSFHYFQGPKRVYSAAVIGTIASIAPTLGPVIGGWITDTIDWHWLFYVNLVPGVPSRSGAAPGRYRQARPVAAQGCGLSRHRADGRGLGTLEYVLEEGSRWNWFDDATIRDCAVSPASPGLFVIRSLTFATRSSICARSATAISPWAASCPS